MYRYAPTEFVCRGTRHGVRRIARRIALLAALMAGVILVSGCPFVFPTPGLQYGAPGEDVMRRIEPAASTRTDVLMMLGDPNARVANDRFFVYDWLETHAIYGLALPGGGLLAASLDDRHALALEFAPDGRLVRFGQLASDGVGDAKAEEVLWEKIRAWMKAADAPAR